MIALMFWMACSTSPTESAAPAEVVAYDHFGAPFTVEQAKPASAVLADPAAHRNAPVRMTGELSQVCQKMGCWAVVKDDAGRAMRITMKNHAFGIEPDSVGRVCDVEGELVSKPVKADTLAHYASEGGGEAPEAGKTEAWQLVATAVAVAR